ncbi:MAG: tRNA uridine-5-carboxymethylaminomethyl(34) synthesis GTPase MnmE [Candidatus Coatesbacteria bacterium]|nr:tRNA uridine-5-carboxymethylaminomethyl(34) synthesis GTPase MnmE [Candidatus Coatesbacteria bacterium]
MLPEDHDTIAAISTASGAAAIGVIRLSGRDSLAIADRIFSGRRRAIEMHRSSIQFGRILRDGFILDEVLLSVFHSPNSYTGEDMAEISCHGSPLVLRDVLSAVIDAGARLAAGGEFTRRAFLNGKMDLCQAEAVMELISAETQEAKRIALSQVQGRASEVVRGIRGNVIRVKAGIDASIDFPEDVSDEALIHDDRADDGPLRSQPSSALKEIIRQIGEMLAAYKRSQVLRKTPTIAIIGKANVGKSTILNALLKEERVITSATPGTTRDRIDADLILPSGRNVRFSDTAGVLIQRDELDEKARAKMEEAAENADVRILVFDASSALEPHDLELVEKWGNRPAVLVFNKIDISEVWTPETLGAQKRAPNAVTLRTCARNGRGIDALKCSLSGLLDQLLPAPSDETCVMGTVRDEGLLERASAAIGRAMTGLDNDGWPEFASRDLNEALSALDELLGIEVEADILDEIFSHFCIGK